MKQIPLPIATDAVQSFDSFLPGDNAMALQQLRDVGPGSAPVYLWGPQGCGKTHLLKAMALEKQAQGETIGWFGSSDLTPWAFDEAWSLLVLDGCDEFTAQQQQAAFALFVEVTAHAVPVAAAGRLPPVDLALRDDLRSRLGWGHVLSIQPLSETQSRGALRREADRRGLFLSDEVIDHLLHRYARDLKHLMDQLDRLDEFALIHKRAITVPLLRQMLMETNDNSPTGDPP
jgi:DnaA family protein